MLVPQSFLKLFFTLLLFIPPQAYSRPLTECIATGKGIATFDYSGINECVEFVANLADANL